MSAVSAEQRLSLDGLPGAELVRAGVDDLLADRETTLAALVTMAAPRLRLVAVDVPPARGDSNPSHRLYELLARTDPATAHARYNALVGRIVSFARAAERARER